VLQTDWIFLTGEEIRDYAAQIGSANFQDEGANTDWLDEIYRVGISQQHTLAFSKSDENTNLRASVSANNLTGVLKGTRKDRYIARLNIAQKALNDKLTLTARLSATLENNEYVQYDGGSSPTNVIYQAMRRSPTDPVYNADGSFFETDRNFQYNNPVALIEQIQNNRDAKRLLANFGAMYQLNEQWSINITSAIGRDDDQSWYASPASAFSNQINGNASRSYNNKYFSQISEVISYTNTFKEVHNLNVIGGHSWQQESFDGFRAEARGIDPFYEGVGADNLQAYSVVNWGSVSSYNSRPEGLASFFSRAMYDYQKKYYLTASLRRDKSTKYGDNIEWGTFWAMSGAWNVRSEDFMKNFNKVSDLKLRVGYGLTGNADIPNEIDQVIFGPSGPAIDPETGEEIIAWNNKQNNNPNPNLQWEEVREFNIGIDFGFYKNRITGSLELYSKNTNNLVTEVAVPVPPNIAPRTFLNAGEISNNGIELTVNGIVIDNEKLNWRSSLAASTNRQKTISLGDPNLDDNGLRKLFVSGRGLGWKQ
jgi:hypothetical protein